MAGKSDGGKNFVNYENEEADFPPIVTDSNSKIGGFEGSNLFDEGYGSLPKEINVVQNEMRQRKTAKKNAKNEPNIFKKIKTVMTDKENTDTNKDMTALSSLTELIIYFLFLTLVTILTNSMFTRSHLDMSKFMQDYFVTDEYPNSLNETSAFLEIQTMDDIWNYLENQLLNGIYWNEIADMDDPLEKTLFNENKYLGKVRLRMLRVYNKTCDSPEFFKRETRECMPIYSKSVENKEPFGPANSSAYIYSEETELGTKDFTTFDSLITYGGGGFIQDLPTDNHEEALNIVHSLKEDQWIDQQTRMLFIDFTTYNIHIKLYTAVKLYIEITPFDIFPHRSIKSVNLYRYETFDDYLYLVFEAIFCSFTIFYFIQDMFEFYKKRMAYFDENWNVIDFIVLSLSITYIIVTLKCIVYFYRNGDDLLQKETYFDISEFIGAFKLRCNVLGFLASACWIKVFKYLGFTRGMAELLETQYRSAKDLLCLNVIFFIFIGSFATFAYITYAGQCAAFKRYDEAFFALLRIIMGDLDYDSMKRSFPVLTPILIVCYVFVIFFVMLNMYLAVVSDAYATVVEEGLDERFIMSEFFSDAYYRLLRLIKPIKKPEKTEQIKNYLEWQKILQKRGYSETEVNASFAKFNIEKCDEINGEKQKMIENDLSKNMPQNGLQIDSDIKQCSPKIDFLNNCILSVNDKLKSFIQKLDNCSIHNNVKGTDDGFIYKKEF